MMLGHGVLQLLACLVGMVLEAELMAGNLSHVAAWTCPCLGHL